MKVVVGQPAQEITDLPQPAASAPAVAYGVPRSRLVFNRSRRAANATAATATASTAVPADNTTTAAVAHAVERPTGGASSIYGVDGQYTTLRGRLEYQQSSKQWKLRYIPIDGQTDQYGGSVVLSDSPALQSLHPGDFVVAIGSIAANVPAKGGFSPQFAVQQIAPQ